MYTCHSGSSYKQIVKTFVYAIMFSIYTCNSFFVSAQKVSTYAIELVLYKSCSDVFWVGRYL